MIAARVRDREHCCDLCLVMPVEAGKRCEACGDLPDWQWWARVIRLHLDLRWLDVRWRVSAWWWRAQERREGGPIE